MTVKSFIKKTHKWLGLIIGIQVLFWVFGGLVMSSFPIEQVHGDHLTKQISPKVIDVKNLYPISDLVTSLDYQVSRLTTFTGYAGPQYRLRDTDKKYHFYDAVTGLAMEDLSEQQAIKIAKSLYSGDGDVATSMLITENSTEYRSRLPAWRIEFKDDEASTLYIARDSGELMSVRNSMWRIFDFVWMLHIMDYKDRDDFNSWLLISAAALALIISLSGLYLVVKTFKRKDFKLT